MNRFSVGMEYRNEPNMTRSKCVCVCVHRASHWQFLWSLLASIIPIIHVDHYSGWRIQELSSIIMAFHGITFESWLVIHGDFHYIRLMFERCLYKEYAFNLVLLGVRVTLD